MKKVILIALLFIALKAHSQGGAYTLANKPINLGWADNSGVTYIRGQLYIRSLTTGLSTDSVLVVLNGQVRKVSISDIATISSITGLQDSLDAKQPAGNYLPLEAGQFNKLTGGLYMNNNLYIYVRNAANTDNLRLFGLSDTDQLWLDPDGIGVNFGWNANFNGPIVGSSTASFTGDISAPTFNGKALSTGHTSALSIVQRDESGKTGLEDLYLGSGYNDWLSTILTGKASTASLDNYLLKTGGTLTGNLTLPYDGTLAFKNSSDVQKQVLSYNNNTYLDAADGSIFLRTGPSFTTALTIANDQTATFSSTVTVADATASTHAVNKGQLDLKANSANPTFTDRTTVQSFATGILTTTTDGYNFTSSGHTVLVNASGGNKTINIPSATINTGRIIIVKKIDSSGNTVTLSAFGTELIDGASGKVLSTQYAGYQLQSDGAAWYIIATF